MLFSGSLVLLALYAVGNIQEFLDSTLLGLLRLMETTLVLTVSLGLCSCFLYALHAISGSRRFAAITSFLSLLAAVIAFTLLASFNMLSGMIGGALSAGQAFLAR